MIFYYMLYSCFFIFSFMWLLFWSFISQMISTAVTEIVSVLQGLNIFELLSPLNAPICYRESCVNKFLSIYRSPCKVLILEDSGDPFLLVCIIVWGRKRNRTCHKFSLCHYEFFWGSFTQILHHLQSQRLLNLVWQFRPEPLFYRWENPFI